MSGGPFRVNQQQDRRATVTRPEPVRRQPEEAPAEAPMTSRAAVSSAPREEKTSSKRLMWPIIVLVIIILIAVAGCFAWMNLQKTPSASIVVDSSKYQAVFFTNGQVYFGKLQSVNQDYLKLTDIFYLQAAGDDSAKNPQNATKQSNDVQLIKLGNEIHGPEDEMIISKDQVLFYENLKPNSKVSETIKQYKK